MERLAGAALRCAARSKASSFGFPAPCRRFEGERGIAGSTPRFAGGGPRFTEEQIQEISKYDAVLAHQIRTAKQHGLAMSWKDLDSIPVHHVPVHWPSE
ncbi:unnamed protein product, partial [Polarella glacialis]